MEATATIIGCVREESVVVGVGEKIVAVVVAIGCIVGNVTIEEFVGVDTRTIVVVQGVAVHVHVARVLVLYAVSEVADVAVFYRYIVSAIHHYAVMGAVIPYYLIALAVENDIIAH
jgi:hypothetical protein